MIKKCEYCNCEKPFEGRTNKKFCTIRCKRNQAKYNQRSNISFRKEKDNVYNILKQLTMTDNDITMIQLYSKVYGKTK